MKTDKEIIQELIKTNQLMVLSTVTSDFLPQSAVVGFVELDNFELVFGTSNESRKYTNLMKNSRVSAVIGWEKGKTVQYEGEAKEITDENERKELVNKYLSKTSSAAKYLSDSSEAIFKITPKWIRYTDLSVDPWNIILLTF
jgi:pyridoxine/pyridoxamine 5'-phosphate oxidase